jgi:RHS repeat-associated protein
VEEVLQGAPVQWNYGYDALGRLVSDSKSNGVNNTYTFDGNGNRNTYNTTQSTFDNQDKLLTQGSITYAWDGLGNRIGKSDGTTYVHDGMGSLKTWSKGGNTISYEHDGLQRRVSRSRNGSVTARYVYDGQYRVVAETVSGSRFIYATQSHSPDVMLRNGNTYKVVKTHLGSVKMIVNADTGSVEQVMDYDAGGNVVADSNPGFQSFGFAGGIWDAESQLTHFGYRDYDAASGTWTSKDPSRLAGGINVYAYAWSDPVDHIDVSGKLPIRAASRIAGAGIRLGRLISKKVAKALLRRGGDIALPTEEMAEKFAREVSGELRGGGNCAGPESHGDGQKHMHPLKGRQRFDGMGHIFIQDALGILGQIVDVLADPDGDGVDFGPGDAWEYLSPLPIPMPQSPSPDEPMFL